MKTKMNQRRDFFNLPCTKQPKKEMMELSRYYLIMAPTFHSADRLQQTALQEAARQERATTFKMVVDYEAIRLILLVARTRLKAPNVKYLPV
jgi:hypothetical protein